MANTYPSGELSLELRCLQEVYTADEANAVAEAFVVAFRAVLHGEGTRDHVLKRLSRVPALPVVSEAFTAL